METNSITAELQAAYGIIQYFATQKGHPLQAYVHSFGCQLNVSDGEHIRGMLTALGFGLTDTPETADLILYNTCAVRENAENRVWGLIGSVKALKQQDPTKILCMSGCMASEDGVREYAKEHYPFVDIIFGTDSVEKFPELLTEKVKKLIRKYYKQSEYTAVDGWQGDGYTVEREHPFKASIPIMYGCNNFCTYCIVPYVRGRERSRQPQDILAEAKALVAKGYKELMLLGQNVNSYGKDLETPISFAELLRQVDAIEGDFIIRFMSSHPKDATKELIDTILNGKHIGQHLHLPVQSGSNSILKRMNRRYTVEKYMETVNYVREKVPDFSLTTDLIVGFPNESEEEFQGTLDVMEQVGYDNIYTFIYSKRKGTKAAEMDDPITDAEKKQRMGRLLELQRKITVENNEKRIGTVVRVLVDGKAKKDGWLTGKDSAFRAIDFPGTEDRIGTFVTVKIVGARATALDGEILEEESHE